MVSNDVLYKWESDVDTFFVWLTEVCGIHSEDEMFQVLKREIQSQDDLDEFVECFDGAFWDLRNSYNKFLSNRDTV